jgi:hypothetical protein
MVRLIEIITLERIRPVVFLALLSSFVFFLRVPTIMKPFHNVDEASYAVIANVLLNGGIQYRDIEEVRGPVTGQIFALVFRLFGRNNMAAIHLALILFVILIAYLISAIGGMLGQNRIAGYWAGIFFCIFSYTYRDLDLLAFHTEWPAIFFSCLGMCCLFRNLFRKPHPLFFFSSGLFFGLAFFSKQPAAADFLVALLFTGVFLFRRGVDVRRICQSLALELAGFALVATLVLTYYFSQHALKDFLFGFWFYHVKYEALALSNIEKYKRAIEYLFQKGSYYAENPLLLLLFVAGVARVSYRLFFVREKIDQQILLDLYYCCWGILSYLATGASGNTFGHYYIMPLPALCLLGGRMMESFFEYAKTILLPRQQEQNPLDLLKNFVIGIFYGGIIFGLIRPLVPYCLTRLAWKHVLRNDETIADYIDRDLLEVSRFIKRNSTPRDKILVWGFTPEIYVLSERMPATRFRNTNALVGFIPFLNKKKDIDTSHLIVPGHWDILMESLQKNPPIYIVDASAAKYFASGKYPPSQFERLAELLQKDYFLEKDFYTGESEVSFRLYKRKE